MTKTEAKHLVCEFAYQRLKKEFGNIVPASLRINLDDPDFDNDNWVRIETAMEELLSELKRRSRCQTRT